MSSRGFRQRVRRFILTFRSPTGVPDVQAERLSQPASPTPTPLPALSAALTDELQALLDDVVDDGFVPGVALSVGVPGYAPWSGASGLADRAQGRVMASDTPSSMSFAFATANLAMTSGDLERFGRALFSGELLRAETRDIMLGIMSAGTMICQPLSMAWG
jgi:CubicO group peptidase (beta-lactamase class C family)